MCGISTFLSLQKGSPDSINNIETNPKSEAQLNASLDVVEHRGPDARGKWFSPDGQVGLGHVRLTIIDLSPDGNQPFHDSQDGIHAVVNGELYGHEHYREQLSSEYDFQGKSDCEIVIALYKHYGVSFLSYLRGEFALVLWDANRQLFFAARDRFGIKSLYHTIVGNRLLVATEMKSFLAFGWQPEWSFLISLLFKVLPGHYLMSRNYQQPKHASYWEFEYPDKRNLETRTEEEMIQGVRERLVEAVRLRLRADVPVGIYLSGGLDSSAIAGIVAHLIKEKGARAGNETSTDLSRLQSFTVQFDKDSGADESAIDEDVIVSRFEDAIWFSETVCSNVNGICKLPLAEKVHSKGIKVVLTGEGPDERFGGYSDLIPDSHREIDYSWPPSHHLAAHREEAQEAFTKYTPGAMISPNSSTDAPPSTTRMLNDSRMSHVLPKIFACPMAPWTHEHVKTPHPLTILADSLDSHTRDKIMTKWHPLHTGQFLWARTVLAILILRWCGDNMDMAHHVESRPPFLDHHLTEYTNSLPPSLKLKYDSGQRRFRETYILREAVKPFVTEEVYQRQKPYRGPLTFSPDGPLHKFMLRKITKENVEKLGFVDWEKSKEFLDKAFGDRDPMAFKYAMTVTGYVVLMQKFGVKTAQCLLLDKLSIW
ncbi:hypothetical protein MW887_001551 [Aspergillus wentii]|nr:hypothetical protein MW887_001551 [Aspergillus wentii]